MSFQCLQAEFACLGALDDVVDGGFFQSLDQCPDVDLRILWCRRQGQIEEVQKIVESSRLLAIPGRAVASEFCELTSEPFIIRMQDLYGLCECGGLVVLDPVSSLP